MPMLPFNFAKAISEPANVMAPMATPSSVEMDVAQDQDQDDHEQDEDQKGDPIGCRAHATSSVASTSSANPHGGEPCAGPTRERQRRAAPAIGGSSAAMSRASSMRCTPSLARKAAMLGMEAVQAAS